MSREAEAVWRSYHESTKHTVERLRRSPHTLDWDSMPDAFRHYEGAPLVDLPAGVPLTSGPESGAEFLSALFFHSCAISATKMTPAGYRYALRVNPSSGNLHPTEFHFVTRGLKGWADGCYHYRPSDHMAEQRGTGDFTEGLTDAPLAVLLTSISWREAWKYRARAYRYCNHDIGHAWQSVALAANALGCEARARGLFADGELERRFGVAEDEWPMLLLEIRGAPVEQHAATNRVWNGGVANRLSEDVIEYPEITKVHQAGVMTETPMTALWRAEQPDLSLFAPLAKVSRQRRSALDFTGGDRTIRRSQFDSLLRAAKEPCARDWDGGFVRLFLFVHRVEGVAPGLYTQELQLIKEGDQRVAAAALSLGQSLAGNSCVTFSMIADLDRATALYGDRGYRMAHWEAGAIGQRLYLASEAMGLRSTGIGAFYDDEVHRWLGLQPEDGRVIYHFATGYPVHDPRLDE